jgi:hypothetical protein
MRRGQLNELDERAISVEMGPISNWIAGLALLITVVDRFRQARKNKRDRIRDMEELRAMYFRDQEETEGQRLEDIERFNRARLVVSWHRADRLDVKNASFGTATNIRCRMESVDGEPLPIEQDMTILVLSSSSHSVPFIFTRLPQSEAAQSRAGQASLQRLNARNDMTNWHMREQAARELMPDAIYVSLEWADDRGGGFLNRQLLGKPSSLF